MANLVVWPGVLEAQRRVVLDARLFLVDGQVQREGEVVHVVAHRLHDRSGLLDSLRQRDAGFARPHGRSDEERAGGGPKARDATLVPVKARDVTMPDPY